MVATVALVRSAPIVAANGVTPVPGSVSDIVHVMFLMVESPQRLLACLMFTLAKLMTLTIIAAVSQKRLANRCFSPYICTRVNRNVASRLASGAAMMARRGGLLLLIASVAFIAWAVVPANYQRQVPLASTKRGQDTHSLPDMPSPHRPKNASPGELSAIVKANNSLAVPTPSCANGRGTFCSLPLVSPSAWALSVRERGERRPWRSHVCYMT